MGETNPSDIPLTALEPGQAARIAALDDAGALTRRLLDLGFLPETRVRVVRRAPLGDPIEFEIRSTRICLRARDARHVRVWRSP